MESVEHDAADCLDGCTTGCVQSDSRLQARCDRKCNIRCGPVATLDVVQGCKKQYNIRDKAKNPRVMNHKAPLGKEVQARKLVLGNNSKDILYTLENE
ncbi:hypothetical protein JHK85_009931 [Glycine max]|nr:hypothetical protein JHK85_009931 [Glycine max]KAG5065946.1 hypothetical protein JHK86_009677 [Glycine max]